MMLFAFFGIWQATLAVGVGAVAIPVVIHLINRRRFKIVPWAAMRFLLAAQKQTRKRMRIEQLLLLLVRMAIIALVLFAMASVMPWAEAIWSSIGLADLGRGQAGRTQRVHHLIVLDASLSMNQAVDGETAFEIARRKILQKIQDNPSGDGYSVLLLKDSPTWLVGEASQDAKKVAAEIKAVKPSHGNASLPTALNLISAKLNEARNRFPLQAVYFFTDMQRSTLAAAALNPADPKLDADGKEKNAYLEIQQKASTTFVDVGPKKDSSNLAVVNLEFDYNQRPYVTANSDVTLLASVKNFGAEAKSDVRAELLIGKAKENPADTPLQMRFHGQEVKSVPANGQQTFSFKVKFPAAGTYAVQVKLPGDALEQDDVRTVVITVRETIPVLLVNGKDSADRFERATEYLRLALNPFPAGTEPKSLPLRPKVISPSQLMDIPEADLEMYDCIFWCDVDQFGDNELRRIDGHLRRGGGFIVALGDKSADKLELYNRKLYKDGLGLLPARLLKKIQAPPDHHFFLQAFDYNLPPLTAFADDQDRMTLGNARFRQYVQAVAPEGKARTVLSFQTMVVKTDNTKEDPTLPANSPALIEWNPPLSRAQQPAPVAATRPGKRPERQNARYRGKVMLFTSTVNMDWGNWPGSPSFGAMMHEITRLAVAGRLREQALNVGNILETYLPGAAEVDVNLNYPPNANEAKSVRVHTQMIDEVNLFRWVDTDISGIYTVTTPQGYEVPFAVNVPATSADQREVESDLARIDAVKLRELYPGWNFKVVDDAREVIVNTGPVNTDAVETYQPVGPYLANVALLIVLGFLFLEIVLAWHFGHYTATDMTGGLKVSNFTSTTSAAVLALLSTIVFTIGAVILIHHNHTGDFLGFLPDLLRTWVERALGVEQQRPDELMNWRYEQMPFLFGLPAENWWAIGLSLAAVITIIFTYKAEAPNVSLLYKLLLGALRLYLILMTLWFLLPRPQLHFDRQGWPDVVLLIDDTRSMGEPDSYQDVPTQERAKKLGDQMRAKLQQELPDKLKMLEVELDAKIALAEKDTELKPDVDAMRQRLEYWKKQKEQIDNNHWRPSRLQLVQALLAQPEPHWLKTLMDKHKTKVHVFHLDVNGRATKLTDARGDAGEIVDPAEPGQIERAAKAIAQLEPVGNDSRLGTAVRQVIDHYRGSSLSSVIMFTDGVTTRDETLVQAADYAGQKGISLFFVGLGDEKQLRDLKLHDLQVEDTIYLGDRAVFEVRLTGQGYKDLVVPLILKVKEKNGQEKELQRQMIKIDPTGKTVKAKLTDTPKKVGRRHYIIEVESPKVEANEKPIPSANLRLERTIEVIDTKQIKVLYVEGQPRYEFRYLKFLLERETLNEKKNKSIDLKVVLLDADDEFAAQDKTALPNFPASLEELNKYDVLILGDCDPNHNKLKNRLKDIVRFVRGEDEKGDKAAKPGGGLLFIAGAFHNPHRYKNTPLASVMPVEPSQDVPPTDIPRVDRMRPELTPAGRMHPIFKFSPDEGENISIWQRLTPLYWHSTGYRIKPLAEVLAVHPFEKASFKDPNQDGRHPLIVQQFVGTGRSMFFGIDETWRWRLRDDEPKYNNFWVQTMRYLSRGRSTRTDLRLDRQTPYKVGEQIKITVRFPDNTPGGNTQGPKINEKTEVKVAVAYSPPDAKDQKDDKREVQGDSIQLAKVEGSWGTYEGIWSRTREGKYRFRLMNPDVSSTQPDGEKPSAEAIVELPPGELDRLRMNKEEMTHAADSTQGEFFTLKNADEVLDKLPPGSKVAISSQVPPQLLWNQWWVFVVVLFLLTSEWVLRKLKHLL